MNMHSVTQKRGLTLAAIGGLLSLAGNAGAVSFDLCAGVATKTMPDGNTITMWGYGLDTGSPCPVNVPGPPLNVPVGDATLTVNLRNELDVPVSMVISGQPAAMTPVFFVDSQGRQRVRSFTHETAAGSSGTYEWTNVKAGSHLYSSGTHPAVQVQMGLYGSVIHDAAPGEAYPGITYDSEVPLLYSEIDPALHAAVVSGNYGPGLAVSSTVNYAPKYFLVNGEPHVPGDPPIAAGEAGDRVLIRLMNAGLENRSLMLQGAHMTMVAEDSNPYPWRRQQYATLVGAGTTRDAIFEPSAEKIYPLYDRRLRVGMLSNLSVGPPVPGPSAADDAATVDEDSSGNSIAVLTNDTPTANPIDSASVAIDIPSVNGQAVANADGTVSYTPNPNFNGSDSFAYTVRDTLGNLSNSAAVLVSVTAINDLPVASADSFNAVQGSTDNLLDVLDNDSDVDGDTPTITGVGPTDNGGTAGTDGSVISYTPLAGFTGDETFSYEISDGNTGTASALVTVTVSAPVNEAPVANDDYATVTRNLGTDNNSVIIDVAANDTDADSSIVPTTVVVTTAAKKGNAVVNSDGTVTYTPDTGKRGADTFGYTVQDNLGATSNEATARVDIVQ